MDQLACSGLHYNYDLNNMVFDGQCQPVQAYFDVQPRHSLVTQLPLHAPVPLPMHVPLLYSGLRFDAANDPYPVVYCDSEQQSPEADNMTACEAQTCGPDLEHCADGALQSTFPTPSELLAELTSKDLPSNGDSLGSDPRPESASKARRRAMAKSVGFVPTDPDTISSHEKKRHYLESLEQYIIYLHQQFELIGATPPPLERVGSYRGLASKSIRTLLVHMENTTRTLNVRTRAEWQKFMELQDEAMVLDRTYYASILRTQRTRLSLQNVSDRFDAELISEWRLRDEESTQWLALCKLLIAKMPAVQLEGSGDVGRNLSNSVLVLYRSYPGDPGLQDYLKAAIQDGILPVSTFVATLLQAARSSDLHIPATLDTLCRIALDAHYSSGKPPIGSVVPAHESTTAIWATVHDALALLRTAYSLPISHFHQLTTSVSELVILLLSCVSDWSQVSNAQAMMYFTDVNDLLTIDRLTPDVRQVLDAFVLSLSLLIGDDVKAAREAQMMHTMQFALGKGDVLGPSSDTDVITLGLLLNYMVKCRAYEFGAGDTKNAVALLVAYFRWSSWTPTVYYTQLLCVAFTCLSQNGQHPRLWKAFIVGRLPILLLSFKGILSADASTDADLGTALYAGLSYLFRRPDIIVQAEQVLSRDTPTDSNSEEESNSRSLTREFLQQIVKHNLLSQQLALQLDPKVSNESPPKWYAEVNETGLDMAGFLENKLLQESNVEGDAPVHWIDRIWKDPNCHTTFANLVLKRFSVLSASQDVDAFGQLCKALHTFENALDIVALHESVTDLVFYALVFLEDYDCETVGDPQTAVGHLGDVFLFLQYTIIRFKFANKSITKNDRTVSPSYLMNPMFMPRIYDRPPEDFKSLNAWSKALFDSNSEGIEDNILRTTKPKTLLRIAPPLFVQAISMSLMSKLEKDTLMNGISYFTGPLLSWTLVGVIQTLIKEMQVRQFAAPPVYYDVLQFLILSPSCPRSVLALCSTQILSLVPERKRPPPATPPSSFNVSAIRQAVADAINVKGGSDSLVTHIVGGQIPYQQVQQAVQRAFTLARSQSPPFLDLRRCLETLPPIKFLQLFWTELVTAASLGELEACRRIATFVLTMPQETTIPPLLPIFLYIVLPSLIAAADKQTPPEQTMTMEMLVAIISSVLNAAVHLEWAMRSAAASGHDRLVLGQSSTAMARRLAQDLRLNRKSPVSGMISQRLASSQSFVANFPAFISELGTVT